MHTASVLSVSELSVSYDQDRNSHCVLKDISFSLKKGELLALLGESGAGKSTFGKVLMGLLPSSAKVQGILNLGEDAVIDLSADSIEWTRIRGKRIAMIYQDAMLALNPVRTVRDHFREAMRHHKLGMPAEIEFKSRQMLTLLNFDDPERVLSSYPFELSGGMCQRAYIALILCLRPDVLIADEPTSSLDTVNQKEALSLLNDLKKRFNLSILLITHDIGIAFNTSDRVLVLEKGEIVEEGNTRHVLGHPQHPYTKVLVAAALQSPCKGTQTRRTAEKLLLRVESLSKAYKKKEGEYKVLNGVDFSVFRHETIGILGCSGCGKSTLAKCISGLETPDTGKILYDGKDITHVRGKKREWVCKSIQMVFQDPRASLNPRRTAVQLVQEPLKYMKIGRKNEWEQKAKSYLERVGITGDTQERRPPQLSTGQCQRIAIARALAVEPDILICDEAVSALDMIVQAQILTLLETLQKQYGFSILMISHDIRVIRKFCQTIAVMKDGCFQEFIPKDHLNSETSSEYIRLLLDNEIRMSKAV